MSGLSVGERLQLALLATRQARRSVSTKLSLRLLRQAARGGVAVEQVLIPQDLRTADPSFVDEYRIGQFGLAGVSADLAGRSVFALHEPGRSWQLSLHQFSWLRHFAVLAQRDDRAREQARDLVMEWIAVAHRLPDVAYAPEATARRLTAWLAHGGALFAEDDRRSYDRFAASLSRQVALLQATWHRARPGAPRLAALIALALADTCLEHNQKRWQGSAESLVNGLDAQIKSDGGHLTRNPAVLIDLLLELLPLRQCLVARERSVPDGLNAAIDRMFVHLRMMRMGNGLLARFNGVGAVAPDALATVLAYDDRPPQALDAPQSGYVAAQAGRTKVVMDVGGTPPLPYAGQACAGALAFELSIGPHMVLANNGRPGALAASNDAGLRAAREDQILAARASAAHNTLVLDATSTATLIPSATLQAQAGGTPIRARGDVSGRRDASPTADATQERATILHGSHDAYLASHGLRVERTITLSGDGTSLEGLERLRGTTQIMRFASDLPFAVHFHLMPHVKAETKGDDYVVLRFGEDEAWTLSVEGARFSLEESTHSADASGPRKALQVAARAAAFGDTTVRWRLREGVHERPAATVPTTKDAGVASLASAAKAAPPPLPSTKPSPATTKPPPTPPAPPAKAPATKAAAETPPSERASAETAVTDAKPGERTAAEKATAEKALETAPPPLPAAQPASKATQDDASEDQPQAATTSTGTDVSPPPPPMPSADRPKATNAAATSRDGKADTADAVASDTTEGNTEEAAKSASATGKPDQSSKGDTATASTSADQTEPVKRASADDGEASTAASDKPSDQPCDKSDEPSAKPPHQSIRKTD